MASLKSTHFAEMAHASNLTLYSLYCPSIVETCFALLTLLVMSFLSGPTMSSEVQRPDDSPSTSGGSSDIEQRESVPPEQEREQAQPKKKETKISSKTAAKLSTSAKR